MIKMKPIKLFLLFLLSGLLILSEAKPKNIILLIGDGMGLNYVSLSILSMKNDSFKRFNTVGLSVTAAADKLITDSAAGATAISTGHKTNYYYVGVDTSGKPLQTVLKYAEEKEMATGLISTSSVTHATPAAFIAHTKDRKNETLIAEHFLKTDVDVVIGGGLKFFLPIQKKGTRTENDLTENILNNGYDLFTDTSSFLSRKEFDNKFYALLDSSGLPYSRKRDYTLGDLTEKALSYLQKDDDGFFLMVEGSQIDWAAHDHLTEDIFSEIEDFNTAINAALDFAEKDGNTLVVVTADHETGGMAITGGTAEGKSIKLSYTTSGHSGEMVGVFAKGPGEELFRGLYENFMIGRKLFSLLGKDFNVK